MEKGREHASWMIHERMRHGATCWCSRACPKAGEGEETPMDALCLRLRELEVCGGLDGLGSMDGLCLRLRGPEVCGRVDGFGGKSSKTHRNQSQPSSPMSH